MNLRVYAKITITQRPVGDFKSRSQVLTWTVCNNFEFESAWKNLTDSGTITLPKSVWINDKNGRRISLASTGINLGGYDGVPLIMRGDTITIDWGYIYYDRLGNELSLTVRVFEGFVSAVTIKKPFVLNIENNMYVLKQTRATGGNNGFFSGKKYTVETMLAEMLSNAGLSFTVNQTTTTSIGDFFVKNETIAEVLERLRKDYHFESYFRGNELRVGSFVYLPSDALTRHVFRFRENIIEAESLEYSRRDDVVLSAVASNCVEIDTGKTTKDGQKKDKARKARSACDAKKWQQYARGNCRHQAKAHTAKYRRRAAHIVFQRRHLY